MRQQSATDQLQRARELLAVEGHGVAYYDVLKLVNETLGVVKPSPSPNRPLTDEERKQINEKADRAIARCKAEGKWRM